MTSVTALLAAMLGLLWVLPPARAATESASTGDPPTQTATAESEDASEPEKGPPPAVVTRIKWTGVEAFDEDDLEERILTSAQPRFELRFWKPKRRLDEFVVEEDIDRIVAAYREIGFFAARAEAHVEALSTRRVVVEFTVEEGSRVFLDEWTLEIAARPDDAAPASEQELEGLQRHVAVAADSPFGSRLYKERRNALLEACGELGFPSARISGGAKVDPELGRARVAWTLDLGLRTYFGPTRIEGLDSIDEHIVRRELVFLEGERFSVSSLVESERRLVRTGLFRSVVIGRAPASDEAAAGPEDRFAIVVRVEEALPRSFRASIGYGTEDGPRGEVSLDWRNFTGEARRLRLRGFASLLDAGAEATLGQPYVAGERARADLSVSALRQSRPGYEAFVTGASALLTIYPDRESPWSLTIGPGYELAQILDYGVDVGETLRGPRQSVIVNWFTTARYQHVDDPLTPRSGMRVELRNEFGGFPIGSDLDYQRWELAARFYQPMGPLVWALRAEAATLDPIGQGLGAVPLTRRLYSGGTNSVRGFGFQKLGPQDAGNDPLGGLSRMELGVELRVPVWRRLGLVGFVDAGDVRAATWSWRPRNLRAAAGPGVRIDTPVGPLRFDFGFLLNRPRDVDPWRFHLSIGHAF